MIYSTFSRHRVASLRAVVVEFTPLSLKSTIYLVLRGLLRAMFFKILTTD